MRRVALFLGLSMAFSLSLVLAATGLAADPPWYVRQATWIDSMFVSMERLAAQNLEDLVETFESEIVRGGAAAVPIRVRVAGAERLHLFVTGDPDKIWGVANWAEPRLIDRTGQSHPLTLASTEGPGKPALEWKVLKNPFDINITLHSGLYEPLRIASRPFPLGIQVQADSEIVIELRGRYEQFEAWIGVDDWSKGRGTVRFSVMGRRSAAVKELWDLLARDFPEERPRREMRWEQQDRIWQPGWTLGDWPGLAARYAEAAGRVPSLAGAAQAVLEQTNARSALAPSRAVYLRAREYRETLARLERFGFEALRLAIQDLAATFGERYPDGPRWLARLAELEARIPALRSRLASPSAAVDDDEAATDLARALDQLRREALLANPLLDFDRLLVIKRRPIGDPRRSQWADRGLGEYVGMPRQSSWGNGTMTGVGDWENEIAVLSPIRSPGRLATLFKPSDRRLLADVDLHWDGDRLAFAMPDAQNRWQVCEVRADGTGFRQVTPGEHPDVHNYDPCYLPNGNIAFISTAPLQGVPCNAGVIVGMMYLMDRDGGNIRQIAFEQDHDYTPSVMNDGRILYLRWDYTDTPHVWNRVLCAMNPDGTGQSEIYGSNSYWPNAVFFARSIPGHPTRLAGIVTGHHEGRVGDLVLFDPARGRHEVEGVVQRIPGRGQKVEPLIEDKLVEHNWPKFLHPWPLSENYYLVAGKPTPDSLWGIYLVDVFDNLLLLHEEEHYALLDPIPFRPRPTPPIIPDRTRPDRTDALVYLEDVYRGPGLRDVPRGTIKRLRLFTYHFGYQRIAGIDHRVGTDGPWEVKRVLGTVPVEADGSALFRVPAKLPLSVQPLDAEGKAVALMRSWMTAMPGENVSCVGCHERMGSAPPNRATLAARKPPNALERHDPAPRGFSFAREVQPVLDRYCVGCHTGQAREDRGRPMDLRAAPDTWMVYEHGNPTVKTVHGKRKVELLGKYAGVFEPAYFALRQFVRVGKLESDLHVLPPMEFHADTSELVQMLRKGHHNVQLDGDAWERLITWIDLNAPCHGTWGEVTTIPVSNQPQRRLALRERYGGVLDDDEAIPALDFEPVEPVLPATPPSSPAPRDLACAGWPFDAAEAARRQQDVGPSVQTLDLGGGVTMRFRRVPAGQFVMGDAAGERDEQPLSVATIAEPFWMAACEVTNEQYLQFDPGHDSRFEHRTSWIFSDEYLGWRLNHPLQPVVRVSWNQAMAFCRWLSARTGQPVTLPTEAQWEYACRAGTATRLAYGSLESDYAASANLADASLRRLAHEGWRPKAPDNVPRDDRFNDGALVTTDVGRYQPNAWGFHDLHGNAAEWTRSTYRPYPFAAAATDDQAPSQERKVVRGGSWRDRPARSRSAFRLDYPAYQRVFNVGFRVILEGRPSTLAQRSSEAP